MSWIGDFIKGFGRYANQDTSDSSATPNAEDIEGYYTLDSGETVGVTNTDKSRWQSAGEAVGMGASLIKQGWDNTNISFLTWLGAGDKQSVDDQLMGLQYNGSNTTLEERDNYMNTLSQYQYLSSLDNLTIDQAVQKQLLDNELQKYTVADYEDDDERDWENTWIGKLLPDSWRNSAAQEHKKRKSIDTQTIIDTVSNNQKIWNYFKTQSPDSYDSSSNSTSKIRYLTMDELEEEKKQSEVDAIIQNKVNNLTTQALNDPNFKITGRENEIINADTIQGLLENVFDVDGLSTVVESYKNAYKKTNQIEMPEYRQILQEAIESMYDLAYFQLAQDDMSSKDAYFAYVNTYGNPLDLGTKVRERYDNMNEYEQGLTDVVNSLFGIVPVGYEGYGLLGAIDGADYADSLSRAINISKGGYRERAGNYLMLGGTQASGLWQVAVDGIIGSIDAANQYLQTGELTYDDYKAYLYGYMTPDVFTVKENFQEYAVPDNNKEKYGIMIYESLGLLDDISFAFISGGLSLPVKAATLEKVSAVIPKVERVVEKGAKVAKAVEKGSKAAKVETATEQIVTKVQKATGQYNKNSFIQKTKDATSRIVQRYKDSKVQAQVVKAAGDQVVLGTKNNALLATENFTRWVAEEVFTSMWYQGMTSYDYEDTDLIFDIAGGMISGWFRASEYANKLGMMKYQALSKNKIWGLWYLREAAGMSDEAVAKALGVSTSTKQTKKLAQSILSDLDLEDLGNGVSRVMQDLLNTGEKLTKKDFQSKIQKLSSTSRQGVDAQVESLIKGANDDLIKKLKSSTNKKYSSMVKEVTTTSPSGQKVKTRIFNKPESMSNSQWLKKLSNAKNKAYSPGGLDGKVSTVSKINNIKKYVKNNLPSLAKNSRYVEKVDGVYRFKKWVTQKQKDTLYRQITQARLRDAGLQSRSELSTFRKEYKIRSQRSKVFQSLYNAGIWDELENPLGPLGQRLAIYVNDYLSSKIYGKDAIVRGLTGFGASVSKAFIRWLREYQNIGDYHDLTLKQLRQMIILFGKTFDEKISKEFMIKAKVFNENGFMRNSSEMMINMPYEKALEINPDLAYMGVVMYNKLISGIEKGGAISEIEVELKLRTYKRDPATSGRVENEFYGIKNKSSRVDGMSGTKVFNDHLEEKKLMGKKGKIYLKLNEEDGDSVIAKINDGNVFDKKTNPKGEGVLELDYENIGSNVLGKEGKKEYYAMTVYGIYKKNSVGRSELVGYIRTYADPVAKEGLDPNAAWGDTRYMNIQMVGEGFEDTPIGSANFSIFRDGNEEPLVYPGDISKNYDTSNIAVPDSTFDPSALSTNTKETPIAKWLEVTTYISKDGDGSVESREKFSSIIPGRTDRVPYEYYNYVMTLPDNPALIKHKTNLLLSMMYNDNITQTTNGMKINMSGRKQFKTDTFTVTYMKSGKDGKGKRKTDVVEQEIKSDGRIVIGDRATGVVVVQKDARGASEVYTYKIRTDSLTEIYDLYRIEDVDFTTPVGEFMLGNRTLNAFIKNGKNKECVLGSIEFISNIKGKGRAVDIDAMIKAARNDVDNSINYGEIIKVPNESDLYDVIYKTIYGEDMPMRLKVSLRSDKGMTPERFLNNIINNFQTSRFGRYFNINKSKKWELVIQEMLQANKIINKIESFIKDIDSGLTDQQLVNIFTEYNTRLISGKFKLTPEEIQIRKMMYPSQSNNVSVSKFVRIAGYRDYGIIPKETHTKSYNLLRNRRDRILAHRLGVEDLELLDDGVKDILVERHFGQGGFYKTDAELEKDILDHPDDYREILQAYGKKVQEYEDRKKVVGELDRVVQKLDKKIKELEAALPGQDLKRVEGSIAKAKRQYTWETLHDILLEELNQAREDLQNLREQFSITPVEEIQALINDADDRVKELEQGDYLYNNIENYRSQVQTTNTITKEQWDDIIRRNTTGAERGYVPHQMSKGEVNRRLKQIVSKLPDAKILNYNPETGLIDTTLLTDAEIRLVSNQLQTAAESIRTGNATAAHIREIGAIVINPKMLEEMDIGHEWFHEAVRLVGDEGFDGKVKRVYDQAWKKFRSEIELNAENLGYDRMYRDSKITQREYERLITEEWLAERFAEFINGKYYEEFENASNSFIKEFFIELWNRIKMMFSGTEVVDLFEDIYHMNDVYDITKVNFSAPTVDGGGIAFRSISDKGLNYIRQKDNNRDGLKFEFGDVLGLDKPIGNDTAMNMFFINEAFKNKGGVKDALVALSDDFTGRGNLLGAARVNVTLPNGEIVRTSYLDIFETITKESRNLEVDKALENIYGGPTSKLETWINEALEKMGVGSTREELSWNIVEDSPQKFEEFPIVATLTRNADGGITFQLDLNGNKVYDISSQSNNVRDVRSAITERLTYGQSEKRTVARLLDVHLAKSSGLSFNSRTLTNMLNNNTLVKVGDKRVDIETAIKAMGDALYNSIRENYKIITNKQFDTFSPILKAFADEIFWIYKYDRLIPHLGQSGLGRNILNNLFDKKNSETYNVLFNLQTYIKSNPRAKKNVKWLMGYDKKGSPVIQFGFGPIGNQRKIGWHLKSEKQGLDMLNNLVNARLLDTTELNKIYDVNTGKFKTSGLEAKAWNVSLFSLSDEDFAKYRNEAYVGENFRQNFREWYNNTSNDPLQIRFSNNREKTIPTIQEDGTVGTYIQLIEKVDLSNYVEGVQLPTRFNSEDYTISLIGDSKIPVIIDKNDMGYMITKGMEDNDFEGLLRNGHGISSSAAISKEGIWSRGNVTLIGKKIPYSNSRALYGDATVGLNDFRSPVWNLIRRNSLGEELYNLKKAVDNLGIDINDPDIFYNKDFRNIIEEWVEGFGDTKLDGDDVFGNMKWANDYGHDERWEYQLLKFLQEPLEQRNSLTIDQLNKNPDLITIGYELESRISDFINDLGLDDYIINKLYNNKEKLDDIYRYVLDLSMSNMPDPNSIRPASVNTRVLNMLDEHHKKKLKDFYGKNKEYYDKLFKDFWPTLYSQFAEGFGSFKLRGSMVLDDGFVSVGNTYAKFLKYVRELSDDLEIKHKFLSLTADEKMDAVEDMISYEIIKRYNGEHNYYEIYSKDVDVNDWRGITVDVDHIEDYKAMLDKYNYKYVVADPNSSKDELLDMARQMSEEKGFVIIPAGEGGVPLVDVNELNRVNFRRRNNWTTDDDILNQKNRFAPITLTTKEGYASQVRQVMDINRKYGISLSKASPEDLKKIEEFRYESKKKNKNAIKKNATHRKTLEQIRKLRKERGNIITDRNNFNTINKNFENSVLYKEIQHIGDIIEGNKDAQRLIKEADMNPNVVSEKKAGENNSIKYDIQEQNIEQSIQDTAIQQSADIREKVFNNGNPDEDPILEFIRGAEATAPDYLKYGEDDMQAITNIITNSTQICG